jgi:hypothetical protein
MNREERQKLIESYGRGYETLTAAIAEIPREAWHYRGQRDPWTIHEVIVHIADSEANSFVRGRRGIAESGSTVLGYDENVWARALNYEAQSADDAIELFRWLRGNTYKLIRNLPDEVWSNTMEHTDNGTMTLEDWLRTYEDHIPAHVRQMREIYQEWKAAQPA